MRQRDVMAMAQKRKFSQQIAHSERPVVEAALRGFVRRTASNLIRQDK
jgi:hypothetical protein